MKKLKRFMTLALAALMTLALAACGDDGASAYVVPEWIYVPEFIEFKDENARYYSNMQLKGDYVYYSTYVYDEETGQGGEVFHRYSLTDRQAETISLKWEGGEQYNINSNYIGDDGSVYCFVRVYTDEVDEQGWTKAKQYVCKFDPEGNQVYSVDMEDAMGADSDNFYADQMITDSQGRLYISFNNNGDNTIALFDQEGQYKGFVELGTSISWINALACGKDGKVYICYYDSGSERGGYALSGVDFETKKLGEVYSDFPGGNGRISAGIEKDFLVTDSTSVYEYDLATQTKELLFNWLDSDINGSYVNAFGILEDGRVVAVISDWSTDENEIALLTKTKGSEAVEKETIVIGTVFGASELQRAAVKFNRSNEKYRISINSYYDYSSDMEYKDAIANLNNDITSSKCPDIIDLYGLNMKQMVSKNLFVDLGEYLDKSSVLNRSDFLENIVDAYTFDGKLITIPQRFQMQTVFGRTSDVGEEMGWTVDELIAYADAHPEAEIFDDASKSEILRYMMLYNEEAFVDWTTGECSFESDDFKKLLQFVNRFPDEVDWSSEKDATPVRIQNGEVLLYPAGIDDFRSIQQYIEVYEGEATCIGFPTMDGSAGCMLGADGLYAITSKSKHKDGAWEFIESYLQQDVESDNWWYGFPTNKAQLQIMMEEAIKVEYVLDENGEPYLDENGNPVEANSGGTVSWVGSSGSGGWSYTYHTPTKEEADLVLALIDVAKPVSITGDDEIITIILEEAEPYFKGQKTVEEVMGIIQSRIKIFVSENS